MANDAALADLRDRLQTLDSYVVTVRDALRASVGDLHIPVVVTGRILNVLLAFEIDSRADYSISMEINPKLVQLVSSDVQGLADLKQQELDVLDRLHTDLSNRAEQARRELSYRSTT